MKPYLERIDTKTLGNRYDVTPLFADRDCLGQLVEDLAEPFDDGGVVRTVAHIIHFIA